MGQTRTEMRVFFWPVENERRFVLPFGGRIQTGMRNHSDMGSVYLTALRHCRAASRGGRTRAHSARAFMAGFSFFSHRAPGMGNFVNSEGRGAVSYFSRKPQTHRQSRKMRTKPRLSSRFCLFCGAKLAKPSPVTCPVRRLSTLNRYFGVLEPQSLVGFSGAERGGGVSFSRLGGS